MSTAASHELLLASGNAPAVVRVNNITSTIQGPSDAWGRTNRPQPISISATVCMEKPFGSTSTTDTLASDTVHYGLLSKAILSSLAQINASVDPDHPRTLSDVLGSIYSDLTGTDILDIGREPGPEPPFLNLNSIRSLEVTVLLPKATLQGSGVSLTATGIFAGSKLAMRGVALKLHDLRIPVLLGVNENERTAKQSIVANLAVERFVFTYGDGYCGLEEVLVQALNKSSFETIEALMGDLAVDVTRYLRKNYNLPDHQEGWHLRIAIEKPIAVVFADAPCVEMRINTNYVTLR